MGNPVRAKRTEKAIDWQCPSTRMLCDALDDDVVTVGAALERLEDFSAFLDEAFDEQLRRQFT